MKKITCIVPAVLVLLIASYIVIKNKPVPSFSAHGPEIITVKTGTDHIGQARTWIVNALADRSTLRQSERSWKDEKGRIQAARARTEFQSRDGTHYLIESIYIPGRPTILLLSSDDDQATMKLHNELIRNLCKTGLKPEA